VIRGDKSQAQQTAEGVTVNVQNSIMTQVARYWTFCSDHRALLSISTIIPSRSTEKRCNGDVRWTADAYVDGSVELISSMSADNIQKIELMNTPPAKTMPKGMPVSLIS